MGLGLRVGGWAPPRSLTSCGAHGPPNSISSPPSCWLQGSALSLSPPRPPSHCSRVAGPPGDAYSQALTMATDTTHLPVCPQAHQHHLSSLHGNYQNQRVVISGHEVNVPKPNCFSPTSSKLDNQERSHIQQSSPRVTPPVSTEPSCWDPGPLFVFLSVCD